MKKIIILFLVVLVGVSNTTAQVPNSSQSEDLKVQINSLSTMLGTLQHDYDYLYCSHEINLMQLEIKELISNIDIRSNAVLINCYHSRFDIDLYTAYKAYYSSCIELINTMKGKTKSIQEAVALKMLTSSFTNKENEKLVNNCNFLDVSLSKLQGSLDYYKLVIDIYKDLR